MKFIKKTVSQKLNFPTTHSSENDVGNSERFQITEQFLVSSHPDSLQITWLEKSHLDRSE